MIPNFSIKIHSHSFEIFTKSNFLIVLILANLEDEELGETGQPKLAQPRARKSKPLSDDQLSLFGGPG